jgi:hypothetical protein
MEIATLLLYHGFSCPLDHPILLLLACSLFSVMNQHSYGSLPLAHNVVNSAAIVVLSDYLFDLKGVNVSNNFAFKPC